MVEGVVADFMAVAEAVQLIDWLHLQLQPVV